jgi:hypothetical protein
MVLLSHDFNDIIFDQMTKLSHIFMTIYLSHRFYDEIFLQFVNKFCHVPYLLLTSLQLLL